MPDGANAETFCVAQLARVDDESEFAQPSIEGWKLKATVRRKAEGGDEVALVFGPKIRLKAEFRHPGRGGAA